MHITLNAHYVCLIIALILAICATFRLIKAPSIDVGWGSFLFFLLAVFFT